MRTPLNPIMLGLLAATLPVFPAATSAADLGQVIVNDATGSTQLTLNLSLIHI